MPGSLHLLRQNQKYPPSSNNIKIMVNCCNSYRKKLELCKQNIDKRETGLFDLDLQIYDRKFQVSSLFDKRY